MPLDMLVANRSALHTTALLLGITPVPNETLEAHKLAELRRHPGSWWYNHAGLAELLLTFSFFLSAVILLAAVVFALLWVGTVAGLVCSGCGIASLGLLALVGRTGMLTGQLSLKGPAEWVETRRLYTAPPPVAAMARCIKRALPEAVIIVGELRQMQVLLDPYLIVRLDDEHICLGIWDDKRIIHQARMD